MCSLDTPEGCTVAHDSNLRNTSHSFHEAYKGVDKMADVMMSDSGGVMGKQFQPALRSHAGPGCHECPNSVVHHVRVSYQLTSFVEDCGEMDFSLAM